MRGRWALGRALAGALVLSACAGPRPGGAGASSAPEVAPPTAIDGSYHGIARLVRAAIRGCPRSGARTVTVQGGALSLTYRGPTVSTALAATVSSDGAIHGSDGRGSIDGQISGNHMDLSVSSDYCELRYALERTGG